MVIKGVTYEIIRTRTLVVNGDPRETIFLKRPNDKRVYFVVRYSNGSLSAVVPVL